MGWPATPWTIAGALMLIAFGTGYCGYLGWRLGHFIEWLGKGLAGMEDKPAVQREGFHCTRCEKSKV
jgi:hypothetical protein